jgi:hypothetical protein
MTTTSSDEAYFISDTTDIEIYGLQTQTLPSLLARELPVGLLRLFLTPTQASSVVTEANWIEWATRICRGSQDPSKELGDLKPDPENHWVKYDVWMGSSNYIDERSFRLHAWLDSYDG